MDITEIRIKLMEDSEDRLRAFCSITLDHAFVIRDLKIIDGSNGPFVAMPSRKLTGHCQRCRHKNHLRSNYCNHCGTKQEEAGYDTPQKLYADVAHPINSECREHIQNAVLKEFNAELSRYQQPGYRSRYDDEFGFEDAAETPTPEQPAVASTQQPAAQVSETQMDSSDAKRQRIDSTATDAVDKTQPPGQPHFSERNSEAASQGQDEDSFGAGIF